MSSLVQRPQGLDYPSLVTRDERSLVRQLSGLERGKALAVATLEAKAQVESTRIHAVGYVGQQALQAVAMVSQLEGQLAQICPLATTRLQGIADMTALAIAQTVGDASRRLSS